MKYYLASRLANAAQVQNLTRQLQERGWTNTFNWANNESLRQYVVDGNTTRIYDTKAALLSGQELQGVSDADVLIALLPGGRGTHIEIGAALGLRKPVVLCLQEPEEPYLPSEYPCAFYSHPNVRHLYGEWDATLADRLMTLVQGWPTL
jgi:nucleoside 2-deoxyribosyltransferase